MFELNRVVTPLRILLVLAFAFLLLLPVMSPQGDTMDDVQRSPEAEHLLWPMLVVAELVVLCFQVVNVCTWKLLTMVEEVI